MDPKSPNLLARSVVEDRAEVEELSKQDGTTIDQFVVTAVAEKVASMSTAVFFEARKARGDRARCYGVY